MIEELPVRTYEKDYFAQVDLLIELNLNLKVLERKNYTVLDVLSDVGGVYSVLFAVFSALINVCNYNNFDNFMAKRLYKLKKNNHTESDLDQSKDDDSMSSADDSEKYETLKPTKYCNWAEYLYSKLPKKCRFCGTGNSM